ncbi:MAG: patatin-like phospholipase family protein, partial [Bacteroidota bacterium]|nr:patatin-like phospholipase family protein [Bacteroidota bacterium]
MKAKTIFDKIKLKKYKCGIILSGGAARGFAHLGVLKALNENNIYPDVISGVSAGALVGAFYADGYSPDEIFEIFSKNSVFDFVKVAIPINGLLSSKDLNKVLRKNLRAEKFEDLKMSLTVAATNLNKGELKYFNSGELIQSLVASSSIPILFQATKIENELYVDGGVFDNLPIEPLENKCKKIIAVHINPIGYEDDINGIISVAARSFHLAVGAVVNNVKQNVDLFIEPDELKNYNLMSVKKAKEIFDIGYKA